MAAPHALEADVKELRAEIGRLASEHATKYDAAERFAASVKEKNPGVPAFELAEFDEIDEMYTAADQAKDRQADLTAKLAKVLSHAGRESGGAPADVMASGADQNRAESIGGRLVASDEYRSLRASGALESSGRVHMPHVEVASRGEVMSWLAAASDGAGLITPDERRFPPSPMPRRSVRLLDLITVAATDSPLVEWAKQTTRTQAAAGVAPGTASAESTYVWEKRTATVRRIAHHTTVLKSQLADEARMASEINSELLGGVLLHTEAQILGGGGTGEDFDGIIGEAGDDQPRGSDTVPDASHKAMTLVRVALEDDITAIGMHPNDYERLVLSKNLDGTYLTGRGIHESTPSTVWGYPGIVSTVFTEGQAVVGNWRHAYLWVRSGVTLSTGYINEQLIEDMLTMQAEYRGAFAVKRGEAFATVSDLDVE